jgi:hypothetical protein
VEVITMQQPPADLLISIARRAAVGRHCGESSPLKF